MLQKDVPIRRVANADCYQRLSGRPQYSANRLGLVGVVTLMRTLFQDIKYGFRTLLQRPGFTFVAIVALALAIGASSAMFSVVNAVILKPLNFDDSENVAIIWESAPKLNFDIFTVSPANFFDWHNQAQSFEALAAYQRTQFTLTGFEAAERVPGAQVSADYFRLVKTPALVGRTLLPEEAAQGKDKVAVVSYGFWKQRFGADRAAVGRALMLNGESYTIVGVMPERFMYPTNTEIWTPMEINPTQGRGGHYLVAIGRLKPGVSMESASAEMKTIAANLEKAYPQTNDGWTTKLVNLHEEMIKDIRQSLYILLGAVGFVLLIACANVANLLLARGSDRSREMAVRTAMGASRVRIVRQLLTESVLLSFAGGTGGMALAYGVLSVLVRMAPPNLPRIQEATVDPTVLAFTVLVSLATGLGFGIFPAFQISRTNIHDALKEAARGSSTGIERHRVRNLLVVAEVALTIIVLIGAGLMIQSLGKLTGVNPGYDPQDVLTAQFNMPGVRYPNPEAQNAFMDRMRQRLSALPGATDVGTVSLLPLSGGSMVITYTIDDGRPPIPPQDQPSAAIRFITPGYFQALRVPMVKGRDFTEQDRAGTPQVVIINEALAHREFPNQDPLGKKMQIGYGNGNTPTAPNIVGVVKDMKITNIRGEAEPQYYLPFAQLPFSSVALTIRTSGSPSQLGNTLRSTMKELDPDIALFNIRPFEDVIATSISQARFNATLLSTFAAVALLLAAVGVYGVMAYSVTQRTHEIGIRLALGQDRGSIMKMILGRALLMAGIGVVAGIVGALELTRLMESMLFRVKASDPWTFAGVALALVFVAIVASYLPARRATRVDPMIALRYE
jgi:putative ABC transport system permease protein